MGASTRWAPQGAPGASEGSIQRILIVDDSPSARKLIQQLLLRIGFKLPNIRIAASAQEALLTFTQWRPDVVFLDLELHSGPEQGSDPATTPSPTGTDLAFLFLKRNPSVKILVCSASNTEETRVGDLVKTGAIRAMVKPLVAGKVLETLVAIHAAPPESAL
jgi:CheY-like chemotaxis protein